MGLSNEEFAKMVQPDRPGRPLVTDEMGNELDPAVVMGLQTESAAPESTNLDVEDVEIDEETFRKLPPDVRKALHQRRRGMRLAETKMEQLLRAQEAQAQEMAQLRNLALQQAQGGNRDGPRKLSEYSLAELKAYKSDARRIKSAAAAEPDNAEVVSKANLITDEMLDRIDDAIVNRTAEEAAGRVRNEVLHAQALSGRQQALAAALAREGVSADALLNENNPVNARARDIAASVTKLLPISEGNSEAKMLLSFLALKLANSEGDTRAGRNRLPASVARQLDIESSGRRIGSLSSPNGALRDESLLSRITQTLLSSGNA